MLCHDDVIKSWLLRNAVRISRRLVLVLRSALWFGARSMVSSWAFSVICALLIKLFAVHIERTNLHCASLKYFVKTDSSAYSIISMTSCPVSCVHLTFNGPAGCSCIPAWILGIFHFIDFSDK